MDTSWKIRARQGAIAAIPFLLVIVPFGMLFGVAGTEAGLNLAEVMGFAILVIAGASQFTALQLLQDNAPTIIAVLTAVAVNLRMAMYSAALAPHFRGLRLWKRALLSYFLVDQSFALAQHAYESTPQMSPSGKLGYFAGAMGTIAPFWYIATLTGALVGKAIPPEFALDFALPITFLAIFAPALRSLPHVFAAITSVVVTLLLGWVPYSLGLIIAAMVAMAVGATCEILLERRQ